MEYSQEKIKKITIWRIILDNLSIKSSFTKESEQLLNILKAAQSNGEINDFNLTESVNPSLLSSDLYRVHAAFNINTDSIITTGISTSRDKAIIVALAEAVERLCLYNNSNFTKCYDFSNGKIQVQPIQIPTTNGLALHNNISNTFLAAITESVERHVFLKHWYSRTSGCAHLDFSYCAKFTAYKNALVRVWRPFDVLTIRSKILLTH